MGSRSDFHALLVQALGSTNIYFQPPESIKLKYPCIVYDLSDFETTRANNALYSLKDEYSVTVIDPDPDSSIPRALIEMPFSSVRRTFRTDNLNHTVFTIYF